MLVFWKYSVWRGKKKKILFKLVFIEQSYVQIAVFFPKFLVADNWLKP